MNCDCAPSRGAVTAAEAHSPGLIRPQRQHRGSPPVHAVRSASAVALTVAITAFAATLYGDKAENVLADSGAAGGLVVHVGSGDGSFSAALSAGGRFLVHRLETDPKTLDSVRSYLLQAGLHGQVTAAHWDGTVLPYVDNIVNVLVIEARAELSTAEIMRVLVPNGTACIKTGDTWTRKTKPLPKDIDEWSHWLHGPDNNAVSKDRRVGISRSLQWYMPPRWSRHHNLPAGFNAMVSGGGKLYYMVDRAPNAVYGPGKWVLVARDAFNGLELWRKDITDWHMKAWGATKRLGGRVGRFHGAPDYQAPRRIVVDGDRLFVTLGFHAPVSVLDGDTGKVLARYPQTRSAGEIIYRRGILYVARNTYTPAVGKEIMAVDTRTGKTLWKNGDYKGIAAAVGYQQKHTNALITTGEQRVFLVDENDIVALDMKDGREVWKKRMPLTDETVGDIDYKYSNFCTLVYRDRTVFFCQIHPGKGHLQGKWQMKKLQIEALDADTGKRKWDYTGGTLAHVTPADLFVTGGKVWTLDPALKAKGDLDARLLGLDQNTGRVVTQHRLQKITHGHHHRCYRNKATEKLYLMGEEGIEYIDFASGQYDAHYWLRGACRYGIMPANGFIYVPPHNCGCYLGTLVHGLVALKATPSLPAGDRKLARLVKGPAYGAKVDPGVSAGTDDWPMFRHDPARSCATPAELPDTLSLKWKTPLGGAITAPVIAGDSVYVASGDTCRVCCLAAGDGKVTWQFPADGPINAPPTFHKGRLVFGTRAGTLYAITADRGKLIWSVKTGPARVHITAFGRLESPWPLNGSPIVADGCIYCLAGRSMSLDSGLYLYKVDLHTGKLLQETRLHTDIRPKGETRRNFLADMLVGDGPFVYMKSIRFNTDDITKVEFMGMDGRHGATKSPKNVLRCQTEMVDDSWLNCCFWAYRGCQAQQLVFDGEAAYGINGPARIRWGGAFGHDVYKPGKGYPIHKWVFGGKKSRPARGTTWESVKFPVRARSMVATSRRLYLAGTPDETPADDFWAAYENRLGARLLAVSKKDGKVLWTHKLDSEPVYNGIAAARKRLVLSLKKGTVACFGQ